jgi:PQQ-dependent dehydrogenase (methanol/ethanol family)
MANAVGWRAVTCVVSGVVLWGAVTTAAWAIDPQRIVNADKNPNDWLTYHGSYKSWHYSALDQVNADNVNKLQVAWMHSPGRSTRGLQSFPLVADGVLYYSGSYSRLFALDAATGKVIWSYFPELNEDLILTQTHVPYNRGIGLGHGHVYVGTVDGRLIAVDMKTGSPVWDTKLIDSEKLTVGFTGAPLVVNDKVIIGGQGGEWPWRGPIFGVDGATGKKVWEFFTAGGTDEAKATWKNDSWKTGGGGGWMPGAYDPASNTLYWGTANPAPLYDWAGDKWQDEGPRPGTNLYTTSVLALDPDTGKLKSYFQELPHDAWDFDSALGEFVSVERDGQKYIIHPNKGGYIYVYDQNLKFKNAWPLVHYINFIQGVDKQGNLVGRRDLAEGSHKNLCPAIMGGVSWNSGTYDPETGLYYKVGNEWCIDLEVVKTTPVVEPNVQLNIGANFTPRSPEGGVAHGHVDARDPITGDKKWEIYFPEPPLASLLSTGGNLLFVPDARGILHAYNATTGEELWTHNDGLGHNGGIISYAVHGKQYIAVMSGWGSLVGDAYPALFGEPYKSMATDSGTLVVYSLGD